MDCASELLGEQLEKRAAPLPSRWPDLPEQLREAKEGRLEDLEVFFLARFVPP